MECMALLDIYKTKCYCLDKYGSLLQIMLEYYKNFT